MIRSTDTLYEKLGGEQLVSALLTECIDRMWTDAHINHHFVGLDKQVFRQAFIAFFTTYILEGPETYNGPSLKQAHKGLQITPEEFDIGLNHLYTSLKHHATSIGDIARIEAIVRTIKPHIVNK